MSRMLTSETAKWESTSRPWIVRGKIDFIRYTQRMDKQARSERGIWLNQLLRTCETVAVAAHRLNKNWAGRIFLDFQP